MARSIDLNCDMGESYGAWRMGADAAVMPWISSANIACGFHGGDASIMRETVQLALAHGVAIGAHVSLPDLQGFGRREMKVSAQEAYDFTVYQIGALAAVARAQGGALSHMKPHGALYNMAARDAELAQAIASAVRAVDASLVLYGLSGSALPAAGMQSGLAVANEVFADRSYEPDGRLTPRAVAGSVLHDAGAIAAQAGSLAVRGQVQARGGMVLTLAADSICVHGDRDDAEPVTRALRRRLDELDILVRAPRRGAAA